MEVGESPVKGSDKYIWAGLSTDTKPSTAFIGQKIIETDTGLVFEWTGSSWINRIDGVDIDPLVKSIPTTDTFHHLGHEGKVFIHSDRHADLVNTASLDILICIPAGDAARQVHMRFSYTAVVAAGGVLDVDVILYKDTTVSATGSSEAVVSTNDAVVKTSGVLMFEGPTITDVGTEKTRSFITGEKRSTSSKEQAVPEWILAPDGENLRYYLMRATNNSGANVDINNAIFFYDTGAA